MHRFRCSTRNCRLFLGDRKPHFATKKYMGSVVSPRYAKTYIVVAGIIRARYRMSRKKASLLNPNEVYRYEIDLWATSNEFQSGHRIRIEISSSNFPRFDRNPNTGHKFGTDAELRVARQTIYHDEMRPSHILLPIIPQ